MSKLKVLELFGGIGACSKALERLGIDYEIADYVEIDKYAVRSFNAMHNTNFEPQDILTWDKDIKVDLIMHGSPCQDFSLAGLQAGGDEGSGTRSSLMYETIRIVEKLKPKYVIWENVKNLLSKNHRHNFEAYLNKMSEIGYTNYYQVLNSKDYGIPQNRERVFTISILDGNDFEFPNGDKCDNEIKVIGNYMPSGHEAGRIVDEDGISPTIKENHGTVTAVLQRFEFPPKQELKLKLKDLLEDEVDEKYYLSKQAIYGRLTTNYERYNIQNHLVNNWDVHQTIMSRYDGAPSLYIPNEEDFLRIKNATKKGYLEAYEGDGVDISSRMHHHRGTVQKDMIQTLDSQGGNSKGVVIKKDTNNYVEWEEKGKLDSDCRAYKEDKVSGAIMTTPKNKVLLKEELCNNLVENNLVKESDVIRHSYSTNRMNKMYTQNSRNNNISPTLDTRCDCLGVAVNQPPLRIRKLTPKECWRLMGFDDTDFEKASLVNSNSQLYKQAGNSIVVNVLEEIFKKLFGCDNYE